MTDTSQLAYQRRVRSHCLQSSASTCSVHVDLLSSRAPDVLPCCMPAGEAAVAALRTPSETPERLWSAGMAAELGEELAHLAGQARAAHVVGALCCHQCHECCSSPAAQQGLRVASCLR